MEFNTVSGRNVLACLGEFESNMLEVTAILSVVRDVSIKIYLCFTLCFTSAVDIISYVDT